MAPVPRVVVVVVGVRRPGRPVVVGRAGWVGCRSARGAGPGGAAVKVAHEGPVGVLGGVAARGEQPEVPRGGRAFWPGDQVVAVGAGRAAPGCGAAHVPQVDQAGEGGGRVVLRLRPVGDHLGPVHPEDLLPQPGRVGTGRFWTVLHVQRPAGLLVDEDPAQQGGAQQPDVLSGERTVAVHHAGFAGQLQHGAHRHEHVEHHLRAHLDTGTCHPTRDRAVLGGEDHRREGGEQVRPALLRGALHPRLPVADALLLLQGVQTGAPAGQLLRGQHRPGQSQPVRLWAVRRVPPGGGIGVALLRRCWTVLLGLDPQQRAGHQPAQIRRAQQCPVGEHLRLDLRRDLLRSVREVTCSSTAACAVSSSPRSSIPNVTGNAAYRSASSSQRDAVSWPTRNDPATSNGKNRRVPSVPLNAARRTTARIREPSCRASARRLSRQPSSNAFDSASDVLDMR